MKKLLLILLSLLMMSACTGKIVDPDKPDPKVDPVDTTCKIDKHQKSEASLEYFNKLKNFKVREKNKDNTVDNQEFNDFLDRVFKDSLESSYLYMHGSIVDYKSLGLEKPEAKWGDIKYNDPDNDDILEELNELLSFDYDSLSYQQQYDYDLFEYSLFNWISSSKFKLLTVINKNNKQNIMVNPIFSDKSFIVQTFIL